MSSGNPCGDGNREPCVQPARESVEGGGCATRERHPAAAPLRLRLLDPTARNDNAADTDDTDIAIDVTLLEAMESQPEPVQVMGWL